MHLRIPATKGVVALARDGYRFISQRCDELGADVFETRVAGVLPVVCLRGAEAGEIFYSDRFQRAGAMPRRIRLTLLGEGGVQGLDGDAHHRRKAMFLSITNPDAITALSARAEAEWHKTIERWHHEGRPVVLLDEAARLLCRAVCDWAGVPLPDEDLNTRTAQLRNLFESPAKIGPPHWRGRAARRGADQWAASLIDAVRAGQLAAPEGTALQAIATHRDVKGELLDARTAAVELINILRPTVAVAYYVTFVAAALHEHPNLRPRLVDDSAVTAFVHEVRRLAPFFPAAAARVRTHFRWSGVDFPTGRLVLFDLYGTNRHPALWANADTFDPDRFAGAEPDPHTFVPQGGGTHHAGHRCAGEWITIEQMKLAAQVFTRSIDYTVPAQDLRVSLRRVPTAPNSGFIISDVKPRSA